MSRHIHTLLATLGGQPQIVTFTLDLLLQRGFPISEVIVVHPRPGEPRLQHSLERLNAEFVGDRYSVGGQAIHFRSHVLHLDGEPLDDIVDETSAEGALNTIHQLIRSLKSQQRCLHLSLTGGRRLMSSTATEAALLNFTHADHIWHIYTPEEVQQQAHEGALMHLVPPNRVNLIERRFVPWAIYFSELPQTVHNAQETLRQQRDDQERARCCQVIGQATERQLAVLRAFAQGLTIQEVAEQLCISTRTVDGHKTRLLELCREAWGLDQNASRLGYHFLYKTFALYFSSQQS